MSSIETEGYAVLEPDSPFSLYRFTLRALQPNDVHIAILYCGICHSDISTVKQEWAGVVQFPVVPGHEIVGKAVRVGENVKNHAPGDIVAVGCFVDSCSQCSQCRVGMESYCTRRVATYNTILPTKEKYTKGGYAKDIIVQEHFVLKVPQVLHDRLDAVAPLLCAGITTYSPMIRYGFNAHPGELRVGVIGLGGLGHMAIQFALAFNHRVTLFSSNSVKEKEASHYFCGKKFEFVCWRNLEEMKFRRMSLDYLIDTVSAPHEMDIFIDLLDFGGTLITLGLPLKDYYLRVTPRDLINYRRQITGSLVGGIKETQEMLNFCADKNIVAMIEKIPMSRLDEAYFRILYKGDVKYRFVLDINADPE